MPAGRVKPGRVPAWSDSERTRGAHREWRAHRARLAAPHTRVVRSRARPWTLSAGRAHARCTASARAAPRGDPRPVATTWIASRARAPRREREDRAARTRIAPRARPLRRAQTHRAVEHPHRAAGTGAVLFAGAPRRDGRTTRMRSTVLRAGTPRRGDAYRVAMAPPRVPAPCIALILDVGWEPEGFGTRTPRRVDGAGRAPRRVPLPERRMPRHGSPSRGIVSTHGRYRTRTCDLFLVREAL